MLQLSAGHVRRRLAPLSLICTLACSPYGWDEQVDEPIQALYRLSLRRNYKAFGVII